MPEKSKEEISKIYNEYFLNEGRVLVKQMEKPPEFINNVINLNKKNMKIVEMLGGMLVFDRIRVESVEKILSV